ncbi:hypothetical protein C8Q79DRAFT_670111 [Trametes meyenii]|nr:hypothetical protein C8Q79DRAFT_670111 [Trametes meyenii]
MRPSTSLVTAAFLQLPLAGALSWVHASFWKGEDPRGSHDISDNFAPDEVALIVQGSDSLEKYSAKPDCFRKAASFIRVTCGELETREDERVKAALFMTLCEIATAESHSPPMECIPFQLSRGAPRSTNHVGSSHGKCVEALSRSAQYWSSYSGYLREVPQLCFAFRRWNDIDTAKELHRNSTVQSLALLRHLDNREKVFERTLNRSSILIEGMHAVLDQLHTSSAAVSGVSGSISEQLRLTLSEINSVFKESFVIMQEGLAQKHSTDLIKIESSVVQALNELQMAAAAVAPVFQDLLTQSLQGVYRDMDLKMQNIDALVV